jgi:hypothetical protein
MATPPSSPTSRVKPGRFAIRGAWGGEPGDLAENRRLAGSAHRHGRAAGAAESPKADHEDFLIDVLVDSSASAFTIR